MKIVLLESLAVSDEVLQKYTRDLEQKGHTFCAYSRCEDEAVLCERAKDADILLLANMPLKGSIIRQCTHLQFIDVAFTGVDHVDLQAAKEMHVAVSNASGYSNESVAELALGMTIDCLRNVEAVSARCRQQGTKEGLVGRELGGKRSASSVSAKLAGVRQNCSMPLAARFLHMTAIPLRKCRIMCSKLRWMNCCAMRMLSPCIARLWKAHAA